MSCKKAKALTCDDPTFNLSSDDFDNFREFLYTLKDIGTTILLVMDSSRVGKFKNARMKTLWRGELPHKGIQDGGVESRQEHLPFK